MRNCVIGCPILRSVCGYKLGAVFGIGMALGGFQVVVEPWTTFLRHPLLQNMGTKKPEGIRGDFEFVYMSLSDEQEWGS